MTEPEPAKPTAPAGESKPPEAGGIHPDLLEILVCPMGHAELRLEDGSLVCTRCGPRFAIEDGIPIMLIEEAKLPPGVNRIEDLPCWAEVKEREERSRK